MKEYLGKKIKLLYMLGVILLMAGCAPGPPLPPVFPGLIGFGAEWIGVGLLIVIGILLWKKYSSFDSSNINHLTEALNAINQRLRNLEEKIEKDNGDHKR